jgi:undecaprenyl-diphosphatase
MARSSLSLYRISQLDLALCLRLNRLSHFRFWRGLFRGISRLGNGVFWYALMATLPLIYGAAAWPTVARMALAGVLGLVIYKWLKLRTSRPRPFQVYAAISAAAPTLDRFSFPSGHTLHAFSFALVAAAGFPELATVLFPFAVLIAASRPILGLHYPSDVLAGALLGTAVAETVLLLG